MIFISHTAKDKPIVEPIALKLASIFGQQNVFYDSWSIQPGDGIIDKMNDALKVCKFFFFFVSKNSLQSKMVSLEWENAILLATRGEAKLIPVKIDDCLMPPILMQSLYIDIYGKGLSFGLLQIVEIIKNKNTFKAEFQTYENIRGYVTYLSNSLCTIEFRVEYYSEPISNFCILTDEPLSKISIHCNTDSIRTTKKIDNLLCGNGQTHNALLESVQRATAPGFPYIVEVKTNDNSDLKILALLKAIDTQNYAPIPVVYETKY